MTKKKQKIVEFERLNLLGKAVYLTGSTVRLLGNLLESTVDTIAGIVAETEKAFREGQDDSVIDAVIINEPTEADDPGSDRSRDS